MQHLRDANTHLVTLQPVSMASKTPRQKAVEESEACPIYFFLNLYFMILQLPGFSEDPDVMIELLDPDNSLIFNLIIYILIIQEIL